MMKKLVLVLLLFAGQLLYGQNKPLVDVGSRLVYRLTVAGKYYDMNVDVLQTQPLTFNRKILDSVNASGVVRNSKQGVDNSSFISMSFSSGSKDMAENESSLVVGRNVYKAIRKHKTVSLSLKEDGDPTRIGSVENINPVTISINDSTQVIPQRTFKQVVKLGRKYLGTGIESVTFLDNADLPLIISYRNGFALELIRIEKP